MTCPTCQRHAALELSEGFDERTGDSISGDSALIARDKMIDRSRTQVKGSSHGSRVSEDCDGGRVLHAVSPVLLVHEPARAVASIDGELHTALFLIASAHEIKEHDRATGFGPTYPTSGMREVIDRAIAAAGLPAFAWRLPGSEVLPQVFQLAAE